MSFSRFVVQYHFGETTIRKKWCSAERRFGNMTFGSTTIRENDVRHYEVSLIRRFGHVMIQSNDFRQFFFGKTTIHKNDVWLNDNSEKWRSAEQTIRKNFVRHYECSLIRRFGHVTIRSNDFRQNPISAKRRFVKMTFGWTNDSEKCRPALWSFANSTIRPCEDSVKWLSAIFFSTKQRFGKIAFRRNDDSMKWWFGKIMRSPNFASWSKNF